MENKIITKTREIKLNKEKAKRIIKADICVVGAGISGIAAVLEAAKLGKNVIVIDSQNQLGGQTYNSNIGTFCGFYSNRNDEVNSYQLTHIQADEMFKELNEMGGLYEGMGSHTIVPMYNETIFLRWVEKKFLENQINFLLGSSVFKVNKEGRRLQSITAASRYETIEIIADGYIDASGDAVLAWLAEVPCNISEHGNIYGTQMFILEGIDYSVPTPSEKEMVKRLSEKGDKYGLKRKRGLMFYTLQRRDTAYGNMTHVLTPLDTIGASKITITGKDQVDHVVEFLKSEFPENFKNSRVRSYGHTGIRQTRWLKSRKQISLEDVRSAVKYEDAIGRTAWPVELHDNSDGYVWEVFPVDHVHYIPLGSQLSPELDNYAAAGRCIDGDVAALSSIRVMGPCMATGVSAAHALDMAGKGSVHDIDIKKLQERLSDNLTGMD
ncbi:MAG: FAD-dependent oxidoreductase [Geosporobacter ferrireducens]|nr:FAD-dependent oxidoreductase [Geosporobacter ferrireducens]